MRAVSSALARLARRPAPFRTVRRGLGLVRPALAPAASGAGTHLNASAAASASVSSASSAVGARRWMSCGIVGMPNIGKSTIFNALTKTQQAAAANYPFCTIEPNSATVPVVDERLMRLAKVAGSARTVFSQLQIIDIAGLVKGASAGAGLGNQFLSTIRECSVILHTLRCFEDSDIVHVDNTVDPVRDLDVIETELLLADLQLMKKRAESHAKKHKHVDASADAKLYAQVLDMSLAALNAGTPLTALNWTAAQWKHVQSLGALTSKPMAYVCNVDEASAATGNALTRKVQQHVDAANKKLAATLAAAAPTAAATAGAAAGAGAAPAAATAATTATATDPTLGPQRVRPVLFVCGSLEAEAAASFANDEAAAREYLEMAGLKQTGLQQVVNVCSQLLGEQHYYTLGPQEARSWTIARGSNAVEAAGKIHSDIAAGLVRAEVIKPDDFLALGGEEQCRAAGKLRAEMKDYIVCDGDIINFKHQKVAAKKK